MRAPSRGSASARGAGSRPRSRRPRLPRPGLAGDHLGLEHADLRPDRLGQDPQRVPLGDRHALARARTGWATGTKLVYVSPLKALSYDVERNLRAPLKGIGADLGRPAHRRHAAARAPGDEAQAAGHPDHHARVAVPDDHLAGARDPHRGRGGDRRRDPRRRPVQARRPPRAHARAPRRELVTDEGNPEPQRIGLSATQRPLERIAQFLVGPKRECEIVNAGIRKELDLEILVPVEDMTEPGAGRSAANPCPTPARPLDPVADRVHRWIRARTRARSGRRSTRELCAWCTSTTRRSSSSTTAEAPSAWPSA